MRLAVLLLLVPLGCGESFRDADLPPGAGGDPSGGMGAVGGDSAGGAGGAGGLGGAGGAGVRLECANVLLEDDFEDGQLDTAKWTELGAGVVEAGGVAKTLPGQDGSLHGLETQDTFDMRDTWVAVEITAAVAVQGQVGLRVKRSAEQNHHRFEIVGTELHAIRFTPTITTPLHTAPYDAVEHRYLRIQFNDDIEAVYETSKDGITWVEFVKSPAFSYLDNTPIQIYATHESGTAATGDFAHFILCDP